VGTTRLRAGLATLAWLVGLACALCLAAGALLVALRADQDLPVPGAVSWVVRTADLLVGGRVVDLHGTDQAVREVLLTWGVAAVCYLLLAKAADRLLRGRRL
jgi:hypothetical protein